MPLTQIEENPDLPQELKQTIKQKRKLEEIIKKMEYAIEQKEMKDKESARIQN